MSTLNIGGWNLSLCRNHNVGAGLVNDKNNLIGFSPWPCSYLTVKTVTMGLKNPNIS